MICSFTGWIFCYGRAAPVAGWGFQEGSRAKPQRLEANPPEALECCNDLQLYGLDFLLRESRACGRLGFSGGISRKAAKARSQSAGGFGLLQ